MEWARDGYTISDDRSRVDRDLVHRFLRDESYWSPGIERAMVDRAIDNSMPFGIYRTGPEPDPDPDHQVRAAWRQVGFARVVTVLARFAYLADVFVVGSARGQGLGKWLISTIVDHPDLREVPWWLLRTRDAHGLYSHSGFGPVASNRVPEMMERRLSALPRQA
jgi:hypothetical protein